MTKRDGSLHSLRVRRGLPGATSVFLASCTLATFLVVAADAKGKAYLHAASTSSRGSDAAKAVVCVEGALHRTFPKSLQSIAVNAVDALQADVVVVAAVSEATRDFVLQDVQEIILTHGRGDDERTPAVEDFYLRDRHDEIKEPSYEDAFQAYAGEYFSYFFGPRLRAVDTVLEFESVGSPAGEPTTTSKQARTEKIREQLRTTSSARTHKIKFFRAAARKHAAEPLYHSAARWRHRSSALFPKKVQQLKQIDRQRDKVLTEIHPQVYEDVFSGDGAAARGNFRYDLLNHHNKARCAALIRAQRRTYDWVVFTRNDLFWAFPHPPAKMLESQVADSFARPASRAQYAVWNRARPKVDLWVPMCADYGGLQDRTATVRFAHLDKYFDRFQDRGPFRGHFGSVLQFPFELLRERLLQLVDGARQEMKQEGLGSAPHQHHELHPRLREDVKEQPGSSRVALAKLSAMVSETLFRMWQLWVLQRDANTRLAAELVVSRIVEYYQLVVGRYECTQFLLDSRIDRRRREASSKMNGSQLSDQEQEMSKSQERDSRLYVRGATTADIYINPDIVYLISQAFSAGGKDKTDYSTGGGSALKQAEATEDSFSSQIHRLMVAPKISAKSSQQVTNNDFWFVHPEPVAQEKCAWQYQNFYPRLGPRDEYAKKRMLCSVHVRRDYYDRARELHHQVFHLAEKSQASDNLQKKTSTSRAASASDSTPPFVKFTGALGRAANVVLPLLQQNSDEAAPTTSSSHQGGVAPLDEEQLLVGLITAFRLNNTKALGERGWLAGGHPTRRQRPLVSAEVDDEVNTGVFDCSAELGPTRYAQATWETYFRNLSAHFFDPQVDHENFSHGFACRRLRMSGVLRIDPTRLDVLYRLQAHRRDRESNRNVTLWSSAILAQQVIESGAAAASNHRRRSYDVAAHTREDAISARRVPCIFFDDTWCGREMLNDTAQQFVNLY
ncbi:unnamed protein product [Amoebophrya sp. A120]|nr:unnamed protein product [Amoebophrya sp. A120]|eukprot:GSA120T00018075001.1